jgi:hypothetical protein
VRNKKEKVSGKHLHLYRSPLIKQRLWITFCKRLKIKILDYAFDVGLGVGITGLDYDFGSPYIHLGRPYIT